MELTAEEWRKRFEKERDKNARLKLLLEKYEAELNRWRTGDNVPQNEQMELKVMENLANSSSTQNLTFLSKVPATGTKLPLLLLNISPVCGNVEE